MRFLLLAVPLCVLAACGSDEPANDAVNVAAPELRKGPMLGDVDLSQPVRASGAAPFWAVEIAPGRITYADFAGKESQVTDFYPISPKMDGDRAVFDTQNAKGEAVTITLTRAACMEKGKPPVENPLTAELKIGKRIFTGCARARPEEIYVEPAGNAASPASGNASAGAGS